MPTPGPFAPTVTQHVAGEPTEDAHHNEVIPFTDRLVQALAEYPGGSGSGRATSTEVDDILTADRVLLFTPDVQVASADEFTGSDGNRYTVQGVPGPFASPFTGTAVTQVNLRRVTTSS